LKTHDPLDVFKAVGAIVILLVIVAFSIYYYQVEEERLRQEELQVKEESVESEPIGSLRLIVIAPYQVHVNDVTPIKIKIVDSNGSVVESREDVIEISLFTQGKSMVGINSTGRQRIAWSNSVDFALNGGTGEFLFKAIDIETVTIIAKQLSGETPLEETRTMFILIRERT
jgi:hypothetical protein